MDIINKIAQIITEDPDDYADLPDEDTFARPISDEFATYTWLCAQTFADTIRAGQFPSWPEQLLCNINDAAQAGEMDLNGPLDGNSLGDDPFIVEFGKLHAGGGIVTVSGHGARDLEIPFKDTETLGDWWNRIWEKFQL